jgi:putative copper export protein
MILESLQPDPSLLDGATVWLRAATYVATLGAAGLALFGIGFGHRLSAEEQGALRRWLVAGVAAGLALSLAALALRVLVLTAGAGVTDAAVWGAVLRSRIGDAFFLRAAGLLLLLGLLARAPAGLAAAAIGVALVLASYAAMGHSMLFRPRQELAALLVLHLAALAFWVGSLPPLARVAERGDAAAAALIADWSRLALAAVLLLALSGALLAWYVTWRLDRLLDAWHGWALVAKLLLLLPVLALAAWNKARRTPALARGEPRAGAALARAIRIETALMLLVFLAAAEMVSVHPVDYGHRVPG